MKFIELTYFRSPTRYGTTAGKTIKKFLLNINNIVTITDYTDSTRINLYGKDSIEVCENAFNIQKKIYELNEGQNRRSEEDAKYI